MFFSRPGTLSLFFFCLVFFVHREPQGAMQTAKKGALFMPISHAFKTAEGGIHIKPYNQTIFEFQCGASERCLNWVGILLF